MELVYNLNNKYPLPIFHYKWIDILHQTIRTTAQQKTLIEKMPAIPEGSLVLVTGASGFIGTSFPAFPLAGTLTDRAFTPSCTPASHLCSTLLMNGHKVRGTVRSADKGEYLKRLYDGVGDFEYVIVEDIADVRLPFCYLSLVLLER
jgi:hypothetical protein